MPLPDFVGIGPGRAGTSWLYEVLRTHPDVDMARGVKEVMFFNRYYAKGLPWYESFFQGEDSDRRRGEITNRYIFDPRVAERMARDIPNARLVVCLRNPFERLLSVATFMRREGLDVTSLEDALQVRPALVEEGRYWALLQPFVEHFEGRIHFLRFEEMAEAPRSATTSLFRFLGVKDDHFPEVARRQVNRSVVPRFPGSGRLTKGVARGLRRLGAYGALTALKRSDLVKGIFMKPARPEATLAYSPDTRAHLESTLGPDIAALGRYLGEDLSSRWRWPAKDGAIG